MDPKISGLGETEDSDNSPETSVNDSAQPQAPTEADTARKASAESDASEVSSSDVETSDSIDESSEDDAATDIETGDVTEDSPVETPAAQQEAPAAAAEVVSKSGIKTGDLIEGTIVQTSPTAVTVDLGSDHLGVIPGAELEKMSRNVIENMREGAPITVFVVNPQDLNGQAVLSVNRATEELDWIRAKDFQQSQDVLETRVAGYNKGGLIVRFGRVRGFVPQSQFSADRRRAITGETPEEQFSRMVNEPITVKVMEVDRERNRLILSERSASREGREKRKEQLISQLTVGEVRDGRVVSLEDFGAFVDIGGAEGLVHLTELSWQHVTHPRELLQVGQEVKVEVISVDKDNKRIGLSMKRQEPDPWDVVATRYGVGQLVQGEVTKLTKFGAFARLVDIPEVEGLIHISELSDKRVNHPREVVNEGDKMTLRIVKMDIKQRRLGLSLKKVNSAEYMDQDWSN
jgi:small subunit ribosomal protein S1